MRSCGAPQLPQVFSTRSPDWKFIASERFDDAVLSKSFAEATFTTVDVVRRFVSLRVADTTTSSTRVLDSLSTKLSSMDVLALMLNVSSMVS